MCFNESLRIEPPSLLTTPSFYEQDTTILDGKYKIKKGTDMTILIHNIHHNKKYWIDPEKFIPERFDPESKYYKQPDGKKRHPMAFIPFSGGKRICTGKTFAEVVGKFVVPGILGRF